MRKSVTPSVSCRKQYSRSCRYGTFGSELVLLGQPARSLQHRCGSFRQCFSSFDLLTVVMKGTCYSDKLGLKRDGTPGSFPSLSAPKACFEFLSIGNHGLLKKPSGNYRTSFQDACLYANRAHPSLRLLMVEGCTQRCPGRQERLPYSLALPSQLCMQRELSFSYIRFCFPHFLVSFPFLAFLFWKSSFKVIENNN